MNVLIMSDFRAKCSGNFINSLLHLAGKLKERDWNPIFMFPLLDDGSEMDWISYIKSPEMGGVSGHYI